jgi:hypothetical protein
VVGQYRDAANLVIVEGTAESKLDLNFARVESGARGYVDDKGLQERCWHVSVGQYAKADIVGGDC